MRDGIDLAARIDQQEMVLYASPAYLAVRGTPQHIEQLAAHTAVVFRQPASGRNRLWRSRQNDRTAELHPPSTVRANDGKGLIVAARLGLGLVQVSDCFIDDDLVRAANRWCCRPRAGSSPRRSLRSTHRAGSCRR